MQLAKNKLLNVARFKLQQEDDLAHGRGHHKLYKKTIKQALEQLRIHQREGVSAADLIDKYTWLIDQLVVLAWHQQIAPHQKAMPTFCDTIELVAVGGYGRGELHPYSDVDLLILLGGDNYDAVQGFVESFLRFLWDIGLDVGHSVRSIKDCIKEARLDVTVMTNLLEARQLTGKESLFNVLDDKLRTSRIWPNDKFFKAKLNEQQERHAQYQDSAYSLEPNIKESPGGLRDLQTILWVYNRHFGVRSFREMHDLGHINDDEYRLLIRARNILWKMRSGLHLNTNRHEDRLLFDTQRQLAKDFGYQTTPAHLDVEQLMKRYYRTAQQVGYLNEVLLAHYRVTHSTRFSPSVSKVIDGDFLLKNKMLQQHKTDLFKRKPHAMIKLFVLMQKHKITIIHPDTIRSIRANLGQINSTFRASKKAQNLFLSLFKSDGIALTNALVRMNAYGLLGAYLPSFGAIVGQMQHDLFHVYTVDGHTLKVIQYLTRLRKYPDEFPLASRLLADLYRPERLFIGALFHDIAKGRGGDHSVLGESEAISFCLQHGMSEYDAKLVGWLVLQHLIMSHFSQRRDISDPEVIKEFADIVGDIEHLDNLYLLTLADIRGTSPKLWNAWKGQLLLQLYEATRHALEHGMSQAENQNEHVRDNKQTAMAIIHQQLTDTSIDDQAILDFWQTLPKAYFVRNLPYYIAWHAVSLCQSPAIHVPIVSVRYSERLEANMVFVFAADSKSLLTRVTGSFDALDINIIEAQLQQSEHNYALYSFNAIAPDNQSAQEHSYMQFLETQLRNRMMQANADKAISRRNTSRALKHFPIKPKVSFTFNRPNYSAMEVVAQDQPGLLHNVARILQQHDIKLVSARITTFGERAEDIFYIQQHDKTPVTKKTLLNKLDKSICAALDRNKNVLTKKKPNAKTKPLRS